MRSGLSSCIARRYLSQKRMNCEIHKFCDTAMVSERGVPHLSKRGSGWAQHQQLSLDCHSGYHHRHHHFGKRKNLGAVVVPLAMQCLIITITVTVTTTTCTNLGSTECSRRSQWENPNARPAPGWNAWYSFWPKVRQIQIQIQRQRQMWRACRHSFLPLVRQIQIQMQWQIQTWIASMTNTNTITITTTTMESLYSFWPNVRRWKTFIWIQI